MVTELLLMTISLALEPYVARERALQCEREAEIRVELAHRQQLATIDAEVLRAADRMGRIVQEEQRSRPRITH